MAIQIIVIIFILLMVALGGASLYIVLNPKYKVSASAQGDEESEPVATNPVNKETIGDTKEFYPVKEFFSYAIGLGNHEYRSIIEVGSINYGLLSPQEQQIVDMSYQQFLNSVSFPIELYIQTTEFDEIAMQNELHENILNSVKMFPTINEYAKQYEESMGYLTDYLGNSKIKKKYVIIPFRSEDLTDMSALSNEEIKEFALDELANRTNLCASALAGCGMSVKVLDKRGIAEVLYAYYHRNYYRLANDILNGVFTSISIQPTKPFDESYNLDVILSNAENQIKSLLTPNASFEEQNLYKYIVEVLGDLRSQSKPNNLKESLDLAREKAREERYKTYGVYEIGEPTNEDYIKAFQVSGSGVPNELIDEILGTPQPSNVPMFRFDDLDVDNNFDDLFKDKTDGEVK